MMFVQRYKRTDEDDVLSIPRGLQYDVFMIDILKDVQQLVGVFKLHVIQ